MYVLIGWPVLELIHVRSHLVSATPVRRTNTQSSIRQADGPQLQVRFSRLWFNHS